jgi:hypothetical protein
MHQETPQEPRHGQRHEWSGWYILFRGKRHPAELNQREVMRFLERVEPQPLAAVHPGANSHGILVWRVCNNSRVIIGAMGPMGPMRAIATITRLARRCKASETERGRGRTVFVVVWGSYMRRELATIDGTLRH